MGGRGRRVGRSYIRGGENLSLRQILATLASITGLPAPRLRLPHAMSTAAAMLSETIEGRLMGRTPRVPLEAGRMATRRMAFDDSRACTELGCAPGLAGAALTESVR